MECAHLAFYVANARHQLEGYDNPPIQLCLWPQSLQLAKRERAIVVDVNF